MQHSFPLLRKQSQILITIILIFLAIIFGTLGIGGLYVCFDNLTGSTDSIGTIALFSFFVFIDIALIFSFVYLSAKKPFNQLIVFSEEGVSFESKNLFLKWDEIKTIYLSNVEARTTSILSLIIGRRGIITNIVISKKLDKKEKFITLFKRVTEDRISIECRKEIVPVILKYWSEPIKGIKYFKTRNNNAMLKIIIIEFSIGTLILLIMLLSN